jgi:uncharacterized protein YabN with tetrapyrrole methylase and pyrophosphatase domain
VGESARVEHELGDLLFTVVNVARHLGVDPEQALRRSSREFVRRYAWMEQEGARQQKSLASMDLDEMERLWQAAKEKP